MKSLSFFFQHRFSWLLSGAILAAGGLALSGASAGEQAKVSVKVDEQSIVRSDKIEVASFSPVVKRVGPSVVKVLVTERAKNVPMQEMNPFFDDPMFRQFFGDPFGGSGNGGGRGRNRMNRIPQQQGLGSGVIVSTDGYILTNYHVVNGADVIKVTLSDGRELTAKVIGTDDKSDLAVIKVDAKDLPAITFSDSEKVEVGDRVLAIGNPFGIGQTVTSGMVSGLGRVQEELDLAYQNFIQTDAAINPGNSGGALVDVQGRLVGINTAILSRTGGFQGIGFAIPANWARSVMEQLVGNGKVVRGFLGVKMEQELTPQLADSFKLPSHDGALVSEVVSGSPAEKAGLKGGDVVTKFNGKKITDNRGLRFAVAAITPGTEVSLQVYRDGKPVELKIKVGENTDKVALGKGKHSAGVEDDGTLDGVGVADIDQRLRREFDIPVKIHGALVTEVDPNSAAAEAGLQPGDVIQEINHKPVHSAEDAIKLTEKTETPKTLLKVWSQRGTRYIVVDESGE